MKLSVLALAVPLAASAAAGQNVGSIVVPTVDNPNRFAVTGVDTARRFWNLASSRRVDIALIGDSNERGNSAGHEDGMSRAFGARFGMYATRVDPGRGVGGWAATICSTSSFEFPPIGSDGAPPGVEAYAFPSDDHFPIGVGVLPAGVTLPVWCNSGLGVGKDCPFDITGPVRYHLTHWLYGPGSGGLLHFSFRDYGASLNNYATGTLVAFGPTAGSQDVAFDIPAGARSTTGLLACPGDYADQLTGQGPACLIWHRFENLAVNKGISYSPLWYGGGLSAYDTNLSLSRSVVDQPLQEWLRQVTKLQNGPRVLLVQIMHGGNDIAAHVGSLGPIGGLDSSTAAGQEDNTRGLINRIRAAWLRFGGDTANLFFLLGPYHPEVQLQTLEPEYEQGWRNIAAGDPQVFTIAGSMLSTPEEFRANGYLGNNNTDPFHLNMTGYDAWGRTTVSAINRAICPADFNEDGRVSVEDLFAYLDSWFANNRRADFNYSGSALGRNAGITDFFSYITAWFARCP